MWVTRIRCAVVDVARRLPLERSTVRGPPHRPSIAVAVVTVVDVPLAAAVPGLLVTGGSSEAVLGPRADHATPGPSALVHRHACVGVTGRHVPRNRRKVGCHDNSGGPREARCKREPDRGRRPHRGGSVFDFGGGMAERRNAERGNPLECTILFSPPAPSKCDATRALGEPLSPFASVRYRFRAGIAPIVIEVWWCTDIG